MDAKSLLIVDDDPLHLIITGRALGKLGYKVHTERTGVAALKTFESVSPRIVLTDVQLPDMDGLELARRLRRLSGRRPIIVAETAFAMKGDREKALEAGCDGFLVKPIDMQSLPDLLDSYVAGASILEPPPHVPADTNSEGVMNMDEFRNRTDGDTSLMRELIDLFVSEYPRQLEDVRRAVRSRNMTDLKSAAHALKGTVGNFSAEPSMNAAASLEEMGRRGDLDEATEYCGRLATELSRLHTTLTMISEGVAL
jgi:two-component system, sensor histidine kinase and response regulator